MTKLSLTSVIFDPFSFLGCQEEVVGKLTSYPSEWAGLCGSNDEDLKPLGLHKWVDVLR